MLVEINDGESGTPLENQQECESKSVIQEPEKIEVNQSFLNQVKKEYVEVLVNLQ